MYIYIYFSKSHSTYIYIYIYNTNVYMILGNMFDLHLHHAHAWRPAVANRAMAWAN